MTILFIAFDCTRVSNSLPYMYNLSGNKSLEENHRKKKFSIGLAQGGQDLRPD